MNWILTLTLNNVNLTRKAVRSFLDQDIGPTRVLMYDNGSKDHTLNWAWTKYPQVLTIPQWPSKSVAASWNRGLDQLFNVENCEYVLVCNNDVELRPDTYRHLHNDGGPFVTAVGDSNRKRALWLDGTNIPYPNPDPERKRPHPDFSCFLIRRETFEKVRFDERYKIAYVEDCAYHVELHKIGIKPYCLDLPYYHYSAATVEETTKEEHKAIHLQAEANRWAFYEEYGFNVGSEEYYSFLETNDP
jgi:GT2 family glycosyltransferase